MATVRSYRCPLIFKQGEFLIAPSPHAIGAMLIAVTAFWFFASGRVRIEIVSLVLIAVLAISAYFFPI